MESVVKNIRLMIRQYRGVFTSVLFKGNVIFRQGKFYLNGHFC